MAWMSRTLLTLGFCSLATFAKGQDAPRDFVIVDESFRKILVPGETVKQICKNLKFTEGPVWVPKDNCLLFSDIPNDTIHRWTEKDGLTVFRKPSNNANGNLLDNQGRLLSCEHGSRTVTRTERDGKITTIASTHKGKKLNSPNDIAVKSDGTIWFTDPPYGLKRRKSEQDGNFLYRLDVGAKEPVAVVTDFDKPNGLCLSPDEKILFVADSGTPRHVRCFEVKAGNTLANGKVFAKIDKGVPDGMRVDTEGRLYVSAGDGVQVFSSDGKLIGRILTPKSAANCCFGGKDRKTLYITARDSVWAVRLAVKGK